jgi:hypothetical protein
VPRGNNALQGCDFEDSLFLRGDTFSFGNRQHAIHTWDGNYFPFPVGLLDFQLVHLLRRAQSEVHPNVRAAAVTPAAADIVFRLRPRFSPHSEVRRLSLEDFEMDGLSAY